MLRLISLCLLASAIFGCYIPPQDPTTTTTTTTEAPRRCRPCQRLCQQDVPTTVAPCLAQDPTTTVAPCLAQDPTTTVAPCVTTTTATPCHYDAPTTVAPCQRDVPTTAAPCPTTPAPCQRDVPTTVAPCVRDVPTTAAPCPTTPAPCQRDAPAPCINDGKGLPCYPVQHDDQLPEPVDWTRHDLERLRKPCPYADQPTVPPCQADVPAPTPCGCPYLDATTPAPCAVQDAPAPCAAHDVPAPCEEELPCCEYSADQATVPEDFKCDDGWTRFDTSCYLLGEQSIGFSDAQNKCKDHGATLTVLNNLDEFKEITQKLGPKNTWTWTGMKKDSEDNEPIYQAKTEMEHKELPWLIKDGSYTSNGWSQYSNCAASFNPDIGNYVYWYPCSYNFHYICEKNAILAASDVTQI